MSAWAAWATEAKSSRSHRSSTWIGTKATDSSCSAREDTQRPPLTREGVLLDYRQRLQELFFPEGIAFDGIRFNRTAVTAPLFRYLEPGERAEESLASPGGFEPPLPP